MCFSNLPVEFDEQGNPYLADEADDVERPEWVPGDEDSLDEDPEAAYAAIVEEAPESVRRELAESDSVDAGPDDRPESARGD